MQARVLVVEDEILVAMDMVAALEDLGHESVGIAPDTSTALAIAERTLPDMALVDLNLRDGATGREIGAMLSRRGIDVVFVTANPRMVSGGVPGVIGVMSKPCEDQCLGKIVAYTMGRRRGETAVPPASLSLFAADARG